MVAAAELPLPALSSRGGDVLGRVCAPASPGGHGELHPPYPPPSLPLFQPPLPANRFSTSTSGLPPLPHGELPGPSLAVQLPLALDAAVETLLILTRTASFNLPSAPDKQCTSISIIKALNFVHFSQLKLSLLYPYPYLELLLSIRCVVHILHYQFPVSNFWKTYYSNELPI